MNYKEGDIAQLGEHLPCKQGVSGSIPLISIEIRNAFHEEWNVFPTSMVMLMIDRRIRIK